jgi:transcriptional regulator with XRE-family HTH domain
MTKAKAMSIDDERKIGQRIRAARIACGISQEKLGEELGLTFQQVQKYEKGTNRVSGGRLLRVAAILNTSVAALVGENGDASPAVLTAMGTRDGQALIRAFNVLPASDRSLVAGMAVALARGAS